MLSKAAQRKSPVSVRKSPVAAEQKQGSMDRIKPKPRLSQGSPSYSSSRGTRRPLRTKKQGVVSYQKCFAVGSFGIVSGVDTVTPRIMNPTVTVNPNGPSLCWSPLRTANSSLHKSGVSSSENTTLNKPGAPYAFQGMSAAKRPAQQTIVGESFAQEDETSAVAAAIRLLESHQLLQQATPI